MAARNRVIPYSFDLSKGWYTGPSGYLTYPGPLGQTPFCGQHLPSSRTWAPTTGSHFGRPSASRCSGGRNLVPNDRDEGQRLKNPAAGLGPPRERCSHESIETVNLCTRWQLGISERWPGNFAGGRGDVTLRGGVPSPRRISSSAGWLAHSQTSRPVVRFSRWARRGSGAVGALGGRSATGPISVLSPPRRGACSPHRCPPGKDARPAYSCRSA